MLKMQKSSFADSDKWFMKLTALASNAVVAQSE